MKPKNFPAQKLRRQLVAKKGRFAMHELTAEELSAIESARAVRTKKSRIGKGKI